MACGLCERKKDGPCNWHQVGDSKEGRGTERYPIISRRASDRRRRERLKRERSEG